MRLENISHVRSPPAGQLGPREAGDVDSIHNNRAAVGPVDTGNQIQERRFPRTTGAHQREKLTRFDFKRDSIKRRDGFVAFVIVFGDVIDFDQRHYYLAPVDDCSTFLRSSSSEIRPDPTAPSLLI